MVRAAKPMLTRSMKETKYRTPSSGNSRQATFPKTAFSSQIVASVKTKNLPAVQNVLGIQSAFQDSHKLNFGRGPGLRHPYLFLEADAVFGRDGTVISRKRCVDNLVRDGMSTCG